ncbi:MAG: glycosyltransferase [Tissierellia bacterium]|nr:glycosyltransferase [Tissierellia bacterium]
MYITQCIIAKNEEENIEHCLSHLKPVVDEQIVIDTGSTDGTIDIAKELGAKVFHFDWIDDFSAARNFALDKAKGDWIIFLDCDEYFSEDSVPLIRECIKKYGQRKKIEGLTTNFINIKSNGEIISTVKNVSARIFKRKSYLRYKNKIHEILVNINKANENIVRADISNLLKIYHTGYDKTIVNEKNKNERNFELLEKELEDNPRDIKINYYMSRQMNIEGKYEEAIEYSLKAISYIDDFYQFDYYCTIYSGIMINMLSLLKSYDEIKVIFDDAVKKYPAYPDYYWILGIAAVRGNKYEEAVNLLEKCIKLCEKYNSTAESLALGKIDDVYIELLNAYNLQNNKHKAVEIAVSILKVNKYNIQVLTILLNTFLTQEKEENIIAFLDKIYDYNLFKDKIYLFKASKIVDNRKLIEFFRKLFNDEELKKVNNI